MYEDIFEIDVNDKSGRKAHISTSAGKTDTPNIVPSRNEFSALNESPHIGEDDIDSFKIGNHVEWINQEKLHRLLDNQYYTHYAGYVHRKVQELPTKNKILHFELQKDITTLSEEQITVLLSLQNDVEVDFIEVPNLYTDWNYTNAIKQSYHWRNTNKIDKPMMALVTSNDYIDTIIKNDEFFDFIGISLRKYDPHFLYNLKSKFKDTEKQKWIHGLSTPRTYRQFDWKGTAGALINFYGIDTISFFVPHPMAIRNYVIQQNELNEEEKAEQASWTKYFNPQDYAANNYSDLEKQHGNDHHLSEFCKCSVCKKNTIDSITTDYEYTFYNTRSHDVLSNKNESGLFQKSLENGEAEEYINSKQFAKRFIQENEHVELYS